MGTESIFKDLQTDQNWGVPYKNALLKKQLLNLFAKNGNATVADLCKYLNVSTPKINELLNDLMEHGLVKDYGKIEGGVGRKPNLYGLEPSSANFVGIEVKRDTVNIAMMDFSENFIHFQENVPYKLENSLEALEELCTIIDKFLTKTKVAKSKILGLGINLSGRVNHSTGYSYSFFNFGEKPVRKIIEQKLGIETLIENDSRAMAYGEFYCSGIEKEKDVLFVNVDYGIGLGIVIDGKLYHGKSGFAGEFGHSPWLDNDILCHCGKKGCLETEVSGHAITEIMKTKLREGEASIITKEIENIDDITMQDVINAALNDDMLAIDIISEAGEKLGRGIALLINIFNPQTVVLGGSLAQTDAYLRLPVKYAINKYSLTLVNSDTELKMSQLGKRAGIIGACLLARNQLLSV